MTSPPHQIETEEQLEQMLARPSEQLIQFIATVESPLLILGAGGKMGPSLALLARNAAEAAGSPLRVIAASRFSDPEVAERLSRNGIEIIRCDLFDRSSVQQLPDALNVLYLVGLKFGTTQDPAATWATNTVIPIRIAERFPEARVVALSTGNVYPLSKIEEGGSIENSGLTPFGEYANAAVARERLLEFYSRHRLRVALLRLFYAVELRYGVLVDIARKVDRGEAVDLTNGYFNCIWQGDANEMVIRALALAVSPGSVWNLCRPEIFSVRKVATKFGEHFNRPPVFAGQEAPSALLGNPAALCSRFGAPSIPLENMLRWIAYWVKAGGRDLGKPTHFETRDGNY